MTVDSAAHAAPRAEIATGAGRSRNGGALSHQIKAVELEAERLQQEAMYELARAAPLGREASSLEEAARANVVAYQSIRGVAFSTPAVETLLAALTGCGPNPEE